MSSAALLLGSPAAAAAASFFTDAAAFDASIGSSRLQVETFSGVVAGKPDAAGRIPLDASTTFASGLRLDIDPTAPDVTIEDDDVIRLSIENPAGRNNFDQTMVATFTFPTATSFFGIEFGDGTTSTQGVGNDSGTILTILRAGSVVTSFDLSDLTPGDPDGQYIGFFGYHDAAGAFDVIQFSSAGRGTKNDDDFTVDDLSFEARVAAVPIPASAMMLLLAIGTIGAISARGRAERR